MAVMRIISIALILCGSMLAANREERKWNELQGFAGRDVQLVLDRGAVIEGELVAVEAQALVLQVKRTSDKAVMPKGRASVPRTEVKVLGIRRSGKKFRVIGTIAGAWFGLGLGSYTALRTNSAGAALATLASVGGGLTTLGYFLGEAGDHRLTTIVIRD